MAHPYKPSPNRIGICSAPVDPKRCKASVHSGDRAALIYQCRRNKWKDGWCKQHHPDTEAKREAASQARWDAQFEAQMRPLRVEGAALKYRAMFASRDEEEWITVRDVVAMFDRLLAGKGPKRGE